MNDTSAAGKVNAADKNDRVSTSKRPNTMPENARPNLSDSGASLSEKTSAPETKVKAPDRRNSPKAMTKSQNSRQGRDRPRRDDDRRQGGSGRSGRRNDGSYTRVGSAGHSGGGGGGSFSASPSPQPANRENGQLDKKSQDGGRYHEENKLSKLMRRLFSGTDRERRLTAARALRDYMLTPEGTKACAKGSNDILTNLQGVFYERGYKEVKQEVASCIGYVGSTMAHDMPGYFDWLFTQAGSSVVDDDVKIYFLQALLETLRQDEKKQMTTGIMTKVMANVQALLESADSDLLVAVVDVILFIAKVYPHIFSAHFRNTVDILVGWHIDLSQKESLIQYVSAALVSFRTFWSSDISFSSTLLVQFLEDLEAYAEDLTTSATGQTFGGEKLPSPEEFTIKMGALLRVFTTVVDSLGDNLAPAKNKISKDFSCKLLVKVVVSIETALKYVYIEPVVVAANNCISVLLTHLGSEALSCAENLLPYISMQAFYSRLTSKPFLLAFFNLVHKVVMAFGTQLPVDFLSHLFEPESLLLTARLSHFQEVQSQLMTVYHTVMGLKSVPLLQESYRLVLADLEIGLKTLLPQGHRDLNLVPDNPFSAVKYSVRQAEVIIVFNLNALAEIANTKSNLIGMWALSPSIFDLLSERLEPTDLWMAQCHPSVQYAILHTLYGHCCRHGNFISSSSLLASDTVSLGTMSQATSEYLTQILKMLVALLEEAKTSFDIRCLAMKWVQEVAVGLQSTAHVFVMWPCLSVVRAVIAQGYDREVQVMTAAAQCLLTLFKSVAPFSSNTSRECMELCAFRLTDTRRPVKDLYFSLLKMLPLDVTTSNSMAFEGEEEALARQRKDRTVGLKMSWLARRNHLGFPSLGLFHSHNFRHVISYMLNNSPPSQFGGLHWLEAMFFNGQRSHKEAERGQDNILLSDLDATESQMWFWATYETAHFTVLSRLRTPLGKPQETFMTIESVLKAFAKEAKSARDVEDVGAGGDSGKNEKAGEYGCLQRVHVLLQYMEHLERLLYNAYEGCAVAMAAPPKIVKTFFRTNRNTCLEWLSRIRMCIITVAAHAGLPAVVVRHAQELLFDLLDVDQTQGTDFERAIVYLVQALCDLECPEAVMGVYSWCRVVAGKKFSWVKASAEKAGRRYEQAAKEYQTVLKTMLSFDEGTEGKDSSDSTETSPEHRALGKKDSADTISKQRSSSSKHGQPIPATVSFLTNEVLDSYLKLNDWSSVMEWQEQLSKWRSEAGLTGLQSAFNSSVDINYIKAMSHFDLGDMECVRSSLELVPGASLSEGNKAEHSNLLHWSPNTELSLMHRQFLRAATLLEEQRQTNHRAEVIRFLNQAEKTGEGLLRLAALEWPPTLPSDIVTETTIAGTLRRQIEDRKGKMYLLPLSTRLKALEDQDIATYLQMLRLVKLQLHLPTCDKRAELASQLSNLQITAATLARKQINFKLAEDLLVGQIALLAAATTDNDDDNNTTVDPNRELLPSLTSLLKNRESLELLDVMRVERESAKLLYWLNQPRPALEVLSNSVSVCLTHADKLPENGMIKRLKQSCGELCSRSLMTLTKWLQVDGKLVTSAPGDGLRPGGQGQGQSEAVLSNVKVLLDCEAKGVAQQRGRLLESVADCGLEGSGNVPDGERVVGRLLHLATMESPGLAKAWFMLAGWCYKWGRKTVDNASHGSVELLPEEKAAVISILPQGTSSEETERIIGILSQVHDLETTEEDISDQDQSLYDDGTETTRKQLLTGSEVLQMAGEECMEPLLELWRGVVKRIYHLYQLSASAYFIFLQLNDSSMDEGEENEDGNIISTLRLLRLLVKHAWELQAVLETGLAHTPTAPWKGIIPQLFARLSHPENYVRRSVSELLCRVAQDAPHLIVYPAIVGSTSGKVDNKVTEESRFLSNYLSEEEMDVDGESGVLDGDEDDEEEDTTDDSTTTMLQSCLASIVDTLSQHNPRMISEVQGMVMELRRITLLWEELWFGTLTQHHADVQRRLTQLEAEIRKVNANPSLTRQDKNAIIREKHRTILKPTLYTMERLHEITSQPPETPHEVWFQSMYGEMIKNALERLRNPPNPSHPHASWHLFKQVYISLQQRAGKRSSLQLKMEEISPKLAALSKSLIPMPGIGLPGQMVTIQKVCNTVQILPTKTKPKKMVFIGSDGKRHPYLFKGLEDLHLDERIMQFLSIVNNMFASASKGQGERMQYRARHYSVTPLGPRSGLIQWVEGATPLFGLYKKWQQREAYAQTLRAGATANQSNAPVAVARPSEVFYSKLTPALKEKGLETTENRKEWPLSTLRKVLEDLMDDTPDDLLAKELWCASAGAGEWWHMVQTYSRSTAVMSMIGYIIGLGDRHLDNVLVDLATGEVVHIDYNVCFEKGKNLRVPERVPFRMTQNIETALGVTGVEGIFRLSSEHVLKTMRKGRETLLTLLEAFVYDPLVDWTTGNEGGYTGAFYGGEMAAAGAGSEAGKTKKEMEQEITLSMFAIRCAEMSYAWRKNKEDTLASVVELQGGVELWLSALDHYESTEQTLSSLHDLQVMLLAAAADPSHCLYSLSDRYGDYAVLKGTKDEVLQAVNEKVAEFSHWHQVHQAVIESVQGVPFQKLCTEITKSHNLGPASFTAATDFLQGAGQSKNITQFEQLEMEMMGLIKQRQSLLNSTLEILHSYSSIVAQFGVAFANNSRAYMFLGFLQELITNFSSTRCEEVTSRFQDQYGPQVSQSSQSQLVLLTEGRLETVISDANSKLHKLLERMAREDVSGSAVAHEIELQEAEASIQAFLQESDTAGEKSLIGFVVSALSTLSKRFLLMESASSSAGERLMDLTSRDGDWFLEELSSISGNVNHFLNTLERNTTVTEVQQFRDLHSALCATYNVYVAVQDLHMNFRSIILPETLKLIQSQEPSILSALSQLESLVGESSQPLDSLVAQLEIMHRNVIIGIQNEGGNEVLKKVQQMQTAFNQLLQGFDHPGRGMAQMEGAGAELTPGQMLLMGFDGLFSRLDTEFSQLLACVSAIDILPAWGKVDAVRDARALQLSLWSSDTRSLLSSLFFLKRLQAMQEFFHMVTQLAAALQGLNGGAVFDDDQMARPIKKFIAEFVRKQMIGFPSQLLGCIMCVLVETLGLSVESEVALKDVGATAKVPLEDMCKKAVEGNLRAGHFTHTHLTQATTLASSQDCTWRKLDLAKRLDVSIALQRAVYQRWQGTLARFQWLHEDALALSARPNMSVPPQTRAALMSDIRKMLSSLSSQAGLITNCKERYSALEGHVMQRLRWAAGANPSLNVTLQNFQDASTARTQVLEDDSQLVSEVVNICQGILHFEAWRTRTQEAVTVDTGFMSLINRCYESCLMLESTSTSVTEQELQLLEIKPLQQGERVDAAWLQAVRDQINTSLTETGGTLHALQMELAVCKVNITDRVSQLRTLLSVHHKLMSDIRSILKTMAKLEEQDYAEEINPGGIREYLASYKTFSENITSALKLVVSEEASRPVMLNAQTLLEDLVQLIPSIYDRLMQFAPSLLEQDREDEIPSGNELTQVLKRREETGGSPVRRLPSVRDQAPSAFSSPQHRDRSGTKKDKVSRDPRTGKAVQERNSYAVGVWRRVKMKLDGRDPDPSKRLLVAEQVDYVIKEARSLDNLALLYEGWTPWV